MAEGVVIPPHNIPYARYALLKSCSVRNYLEGANMYTFCYWEHRPEVKQAKAELGTSATLSELVKRAQEIKNEKEIKNEYGNHEAV